MSENKHTNADLKIMQAWTLERKIQVTQTRIMEFVEHFNGQAYVSFSGGKDSTVLLNLARRIYPQIEAVFVDTGLEYPEIRDFVKSKINVTWVKPSVKFPEVIEKYGYPVISKEVSKRLKELRTNTNTNSKCYQQLVVGLKNENGTKSRYDQTKYSYLIDAPFKISDTCCDKLKKTPVRLYEKGSGKNQINGMIAEESMLRQTSWLRNGCNAFDSKRPKSMPMAFWTEQDVLHYLKDYEITYCSIYGDIVPVGEVEGQERFDIPIYQKYVCTGEQRTGCMFCMFGIMSDGNPNRFERMKLTHPKQYDYCIRENTNTKALDGTEYALNGLGLGKVLDFIGVRY